MHAVAADVGFSTEGGGGFGKRAQLAGLLISHMNSGTENFLSIENGKKFSTKYMANDDFSGPP